jgi:hypothetical protein
MSTGVQRGPQTRPRATYTKIGIGQMKQIRGNPVSWGLDCMGNCWPILTLRGGQDEASRQLRIATAQNLRPKQTYLQSRGVIGVVERADDGGTRLANSPAAPTQVPIQDPVANPTAPSSPCPSGKVYVPLAGGRYKCAEPWGGGY